MPQQPTLFPKLHVSTRPSEPLPATSTMPSFPPYGHPQHTVAAGPHHHQMFRTKRKHVLKACDRCRVKKTKCDGNQPCYRCAAYNHPCLFRERKATQTKAYSRGFVEMLESHHALVVKALQQLYTHCIKNECFPGEPIDVVDGYPLTHAILDRLGLIKQAEQSAKLGGECPEPFDYWRPRTMSTDSTDSDDISSEPACSLELSPSGSTTPVSPMELEGVKVESSFVSPHYPYDSYNCSDRMWPLQEASGVQAMDFSHAMPSSPFQLDGGVISHNGSRHSSTVAVNPYNTSMPGDQRQLGQSTSLPSIDNMSYVGGPVAYRHPSGDTSAGMQPQSTWAPGMWGR